MVKRSPVNPKWDGSLPIQTQENTTFNSECSTDGSATTSQAFLPLTVARIWSQSKHFKMPSFIVIPCDVRALLPPLPSHSFRRRQIPINASLLPYNFGTSVNRNIPEEIPRAPWDAVSIKTKLLTALPFRLSIPCLPLTLCPYPVRISRSGPTELEV